MTVGTGDAERSWLLPVVLGVTLTAAMCAAAVLHAPAGIAGEWDWEYASKANWSNLGVVLGCLGAFLVAFHYGLRVYPTARPAWRRSLVAMLLPGIFVTHLAVASLGQYGLMEQAWVVLNPWETGAYFQEVRRLERGVLAAAPGLTGPLGYIDNFDEYIDRNWQDYGDATDTRRNVHPPGNTMLFYGLKKLAESDLRVGDAALGGATIASVTVRESRKSEEVWSRLGSLAPAVFTAVFFFQFLAGLVLIPTLILAGHLIGKQVPLFAATLAAFVPSVFLFEPSPDQSYALLAMFIWLFVYLALSRQSGVWAMLAGGTVYFGLFFSLVYLVVVAMAGGCVLFALVRQDSPVGYLRGNWRALARLLAYGVLGFAVPMAAMGLFLGYDTTRVVTLCWRNHARFYDWEQFPRTYWKWLRVNPFELLIFAGGSASALFLAALVSEWQKPRVQRRRQLNPYLWGFLLVMGLLWLSGKNSGEAARLWMPFMPALALVGLSAYRQARWPNWVYTVLLGLQMLQLIVFRLSFDVYRVAVNINQ